jgi:hypothetical protein
MSQSHGLAFLIEVNVSDRRFLYLSWTALAAFVVTSALAAVFNSVAILFNTLLCAIGVYAGYLCTAYVTRRSADAGLTSYASAGHRLSLDVYDDLQDIQVLLAKGRKSEDVAAIHQCVEIAKEKLITLQRFALSSNQQWEEMLPPEKIKQTRERETKLPLQSGRTLVVTEQEGRL